MTLGEQLIKRIKLTGDASCGAYRLASDLIQIAANELRYEFDVLHLDEAAEELRERAQAVALTTK